MNIVSKFLNSVMDIKEEKMDSIQQIASSSTTVADNEIANNETPKPRVSSRKAARTKAHQQNWIRPFELGWRREVVQRNASNDTPGLTKGPQADVYYFTPDGKKMRSMLQIQKYLTENSVQIDPTCFTFLKEPIYREPEEVSRTAAHSRRNCQKTTSVSPSTVLPSADVSLQPGETCVPEATTPTAATMQETSSTKKMTNTRNKRKMGISLEGASVAKRIKLEPNDESMKVVPIAFLGRIKIDKRSTSSILTLTLPREAGGSLDVFSPVTVQANGVEFLLQPQLVKQSESCIRLTFPSQPVMPPSTPSEIQSVGDSDLPPSNVLVIEPTEGTESEAESPVKLSERAPARHRSCSNRFIETPTYKRIHSKENPWLFWFDVTLSVFRFLDVKDLLNVRTVSRAFRAVASDPSLWKVVKLQDCRITNWELAANWFNKCETLILDCTNLPFTNIGSKGFDALNSVQSLRHLQLPLCPLDVPRLAAQKLGHLQGLSAEALCSENEEQQLNLENVRVDMSVFARMTNLVVLRLRAVSGITVTTRLNQIGQLQSLRTLSLTSMHDVPGKDLTFIRSLENLKVLELGDCYTWDKQVFEALSALQNLSTLRLECGGNDPDVGLGSALQKMTGLLHLELIKYTVSENLSQTLPKLKHLKTFHVWSEFLKEDVKRARLNSSMFSALVGMSFLLCLDWGLLVPVDDKVRKSGQDDSVLILSEELHNERDRRRTAAAREQITRITYDEIGNRLTNSLPSTKVRIFGVPLLTLTVP